MVSVTIRRATAADLDSVDQVLRAAFRSGGTFGPILRRCLSLQPEGWWVAAGDQALLGFGGAVDYGSLAYVGLLSVHPQAQHQGIGRRLLAQILNWLDGRGCPLTALDATPAGISLYHSCGFVETERSYTYISSGIPISLDRPNSQIKTQTLAVSDFNEILGIDQQIFGADRSKILRPLLWEYLERGFIARDLSGQIVGFLLAQMDTLGPWWAEDPQIGGLLLQRALKLPFGPNPRIYVPGANPAIPDLLDRWGFQQRQELAHMQRGADRSVGDRSKMYGMINYALG